MSDKPPKLDPFKGVFRWAWRRAGQHRKTFWVGSVALSAVFVFVGATVTAPADPTWGERIVNGLLALGIAVGCVVFSTLLYAVLVAPYEQRGELRREATSLKAELASKPGKPVRPSDRLDPAKRELIDRLVPLFEEGRIMMERRPGRHGLEHSSLAADVDDWAERVSAALSGFPDYKRQFDSEPPYQASLDNHASHDLDHRFRVLMAILELITPK